MRDGFTLIEVLIAVAITAIIAVTVSTTAAALSRTVQSRSGESRRDERRARVVDILAHDWRGRTQVLSEPPSDSSDAVSVAFSTTTDPLASAARATPKVRYIASPEGLWREEGSSRIDLLDEPVVLEFSNGEQWRTTPAGPVFALRLTFKAPAETVVLR